jgi:hypothetical protein
MVVVTAVELFGDFILYFGGPIFYIDLSNHLVETDAEIPETDPRLFPISHLSPAYFQSTKRICKQHPPTGQGSRPEQFSVPRPLMGEFRLLL